MKTLLYVLFILAFWIGAILGVSALLMQFWNVVICSAIPSIASAVEYRTVIIGMLCLVAISAIREVLGIFSSSQE